MKMSRSEVVEMNKQIRLFHNLNNRNCNDLTGAVYVGLNICYAT